MCQFQSNLEQMCRSFQRQILFSCRNDFGTINCYVLDHNSLLICNYLMSLNTFTVPQVSQTQPTHNNSNANWNPVGYTDLLLFACLELYELITSMPESDDTLYIYLTLYYIYFHKHKKSYLSPPSTISLDISLKQKIVFKPPNFNRFNKMSVVTVLKFDIIINETCLEYSRHIKLILNSF